MKCVNLDDFKDRCPKVDCGDKCSDVPFRKVNIPASMGDDITGEYIPENGLYKNAFVEYEANGALYIYSSDGIFTKLGFNTQGGGEVSKQYVDIQDAKVLQDSKDYIASSIAEYNTSITSYIDGRDANTLNSAKSYADTQDVLTLQAAKDYTDAHSGQGGVSQQYVDDHDAATLQDAKDYADGAASIAAGDVQGELDTLQNSLATVAFTGDYDDLVGQPDFPVITMTDTDPGEGVPLAENHFIAVYQGGNQ
jgi:hypothetical protein